MTPEQEKLWTEEFFKLAPLSNINIDSWGVKYLNNPHSKQCLFYYLEACKKRQEENDESNDLIKIITANEGRYYDEIEKLKAENEKLKKDMDDIILEWKPSLLKREVALEFLKERGIYSRTEKYYATTKNYGYREVARCELYAGVVLDVVQALLDGIEKLKAEIDILDHRNKGHLKYAQTQHDRIKKRDKLLLHAMTLANTSINNFNDSEDELVIMLKEWIAEVERVLK